MEFAILLKAFAAFFVITDPVGMSLLFHSLTHNHSVGERRKIAFKACLISAALLIFFGIYGEAFLAYLGISIHALKISGGVLLFYTAFKMVTSTLGYQAQSLNNDISVFPLSIPLLAGPGSLTVSILIFSDVTSMKDLSAVTAAVLVIFVLTFTLMSASSYVKKIIPKTGDEILRRFLGMLLAALAVQFVIDGILALID